MLVNDLIFLSNLGVVIVTLVPFSMIGPIGICNLMAMFSFMTCAHFEC
jgi:hypothetical protein